MNYASNAVITRANIEEEAACSTLHFSCFENQLSGIAIKMSTNINLKFNKNARALITHFYLHTLEHLITNFPLHIYAKIVNERNHGFGFETEETKVVSVSTETNFGFLLTETH